MSEVPQTPEEAIAHLVVEKYAKSMGMNVEEAKKKYLPIILSRKPEDKIGEKLISVTDMLDKFFSLKKNAPPNGQHIVDNLMTLTLANAFAPPKKSSFEDDIKDIASQIVKMKAVVSALSTDEGSEKLREELQQLRAQLDERIQKEQQEKLLAQIQEMLAPFEEKIRDLESKTTTQTTQQPSSLSLAEQIKAKVQEQEELKQALRSFLGVEEVKTTGKSEENLSEEEIVKKLAQRGYRIQPPLSPEEYEKKMRQIMEEYERKIEEERRKERLRLEEELKQKQKQQEFILQLGTTFLDTILSTFGSESGSQALEAVKKVMSAEKA